eukprot:maker-scaffold743_size103610-snap-gene-0.15 protein:Tk01112 transcript:maker-scaffold743_size103610-snap-gene-0.15-mRNA-1 annotation:"large neutral amino acids transporter small subunit 2-like"
MTQEESGKNPEEESSPRQSMLGGEIPKANSATCLKRELGLLDGCSIIIGIIVGSGIFVSPKGVLQNVGSVGMSLVVWLASGLLSLIGALCYAELGTMIPKSGGDYAYIYEAFGPYPAFLYQFAALLVIMPAGNTITAITFASYVLQPFWPECEPPVEAVRLIAALLLCTLTALNCYNVKSVTKIQDLFSATKILALVTIIAAGFVWIGFGHVENLADPMKDTTLSPGHLALSFYSGIFCFAGWNYLNFVTEEMKNPERDLPRAIYITIPMITVIYLLANLAYFSVLSTSEILSSNAVAVTFGNRLLGSWSWIMPVFVMCSTFGAVNGGIFASSRVFFVGARNGHMPQAMALININSFTPIPCLIMLCCISLVMLSSDDVYRLINYTSFMESLFITISVAGLLYLRYKEPNRARPIRVQLVYPIVFFILCTFLVLLPLFVTPLLVGVDLLILALGSVFYLIFVKIQSKPNVIQKLLRKLLSGSIGFGLIWSWKKFCFLDCVDQAIQKLFLGVLEEHED